jgi:hypothetical protein
MHTSTKDIIFKSIYVPHTCDLHHIMLQHILNPILERCCGTGAARATATHLYNDLATLFIELYKTDVTAVLLDEWPDSRRKDFFYHLHSF